MWAEGRKITLQLDAPADPPWVHVDPERIRQVLTNLLSNALRYTPPGGTVRVRVLREDADRAAAAVEDTGGGTPPAAGHHDPLRFRLAPARAKGGVRDEEAALVRTAIPHRPAGDALSRHR